MLSLTRNSLREPAPLVKYFHVKNRARVTHQNCRVLPVWLRLLLLSDFRDTTAVPGAVRRRMLPWFDVEIGAKSECLAAVAVASSVKGSKEENNRAHLSVAQIRTIGGEWFCNSFRGGGRGGGGVFGDRL